MDSARQTGTSTECKVDSHPRNLFHMFLTGSGSCFGYRYMHRCSSVAMHADWSCRTHFRHRIKAATPAVADMDKNCSRARGDCELCNVCPCRNSALPKRKEENSTVQQWSPRDAPISAYIHVCWRFVVPAFVKQKKSEPVRDPTRANAAHSIVAIQLIACEFNATHPSESTQNRKSLSSHTR